MQLCTHLGYPDPLGGARTIADSAGRYLGAFRQTAGCLLLRTAAGSIPFIFLCFASRRPCSGMALMPFLRLGCQARARPPNRAQSPKPPNLSRDARLTADAGA